MITIKYLDPSKNQQWDDFVLNQDNSTFFHLSGWKEVIERSFNHKTYFLYAAENDDIVGVLPLARIKSYLFSDTLISLPFCVSAGILTERPDVKTALIEESVKIAQELNVETLELRHENLEIEDWPRKALYVSFKKEIDPDVEKNLSAIPRKQRAMVRKGIKNGLVGHEDQDIERIYDAYSESVHNLGTPIFSKNYLRILKEVFKDKCRILSITDKDEQLVASVMSFYFKDQVLPYYGGGKFLARSNAGNDFLYWELMRRSCEEGIKVFDFGRSKEGTGSYRFKKHWGFDPVPLHYEVKLISATEIPEINPLNPKYQYFIKMWKKMPLQMANKIGPFLAHSLG